MNHADIKGWFDAGIAKLYSEMVWGFPANSIFVEVGACFGKSTAYMCEQINLAEKPISFYTVDIWQNNDHFLHFQRNMIACGVNSLVKPVRAPSTLAALQFLDKSLDFVFIDACHKYNSVKNDILAWLPKMKPGATLAGHDYGAPQCQGVQKAVDEIIGKKNYEVWKTTWVHKIG